MSYDKTVELQDLARTMVGDGGSPNIYFVSQDGVIVTVTYDGELAHKQWKRLARQTPSVECELEDRQTGSLCHRYQHEETKRWESYDDFEFFAREVS